MLKMAILLIAVVIIFTCDSGYGSFDSTPKDISSTNTKSFVLRCDPAISDVLAVLAIHIRKKTDSVAVEAALSQGESGGVAAAPPAVQTTPEAQKEDKHDNQPQTIEYPKYDERLDHLKKRSTDTEFVRVTLTSGNAIDIVPPINRFKALGSVAVPAYLSVTFENPDDTDLGTFECQATYLDSSGEVRTSSELTYVSKGEGVTCEDFEKRLKSLEEERQSFLVVLQEVHRMAKDAQSEHSQVQSDVDSLRLQIKALFDTVELVTQQLNNLDDRVTAVSKHSGKQGSSDKSGDNGSQTQLESERRSDELFKLNSKLDQVVNIQVLGLVKHVQDLTNHLRDTQDRITVLELTVSGTVNNRIQALENVNVPAIAESLQDIEMRTIPLIEKNLTDVRTILKELRSYVFERHEGESNTAKEAPPSGTSSTTTTAPSVPAEVTTTTVTYTSPACYVCGNNITEEFCLESTIKNTKECPKGQHNCITDVYQDGETRHVYKRCASVKDCREGNTKSMESCKTENFFESKVLECHYCCTSILCNEEIRPPKDMF